MSEKKKFRDTMVGGFLSKKLPAVLDIVGDVLPDKGVLGIVKNIVSRDKSLSDEDQEEFGRLMEQDIEMEKVHAADRASARSREVELERVGGSNWFQYVVGLSVIMAYCTIIYVVLFVHVQDKELFYFIAGNVFAFAAAVVTYYFGSSKSSADKNKILQNQKS